MMDDISVRPYFVRAVYQWCVDEGYTPYLLAHWSEDNASPVPKRLINAGKIVFNISPHAVRHLMVNAEGVFFTARFLGKTAEVHVPLADVVSVYAQERQSGISFPPPATTPPEERKPAAARRKMTRADIKII